MEEEGGARQAQRQWGHGGHRHPPQHTAGGISWNLRASPHGKVTW